MDVLETLEKLVEKPELFLSADIQKSVLFLQTLQKLYATTKSTESKPVGDSLPELIIDGCDDEQIWQELELHNEPVLDNSLEVISKLAVDKSLLSDISSDKQSRQTKKRLKDNITVDLPTQSSKTRNETREHNEDSSDFEGSDSNENDQTGIADNESDDNLDDDAGDDDFDSKDGSDADIIEHDDVDEDDEEEAELERLLEAARAEDNNGASGEDSDSDIGGDIGAEKDDDLGNSDDNDDDNDDYQEKAVDDTVVKKYRKNKNAKQFKSGNDVVLSQKTSSAGVEDRFFDLEEMDAFLDKEENGQLDLPDDEDVDVFADIGDDNTQGVKGSEACYTDYFDPPKSDSDSAKKLKKKKQVHILENDMPDSDEENVSTTEDNEMKLSSKADQIEIDDAVLKSSFEKRQERLKKKISKMEESNLAEKPWQLKGEVAGVARPENSLLQEHLEFEHTSRPVPVITEETTQKLTDIIKQRIKDKAWDDVERKQKPVENVGEYKRRIVLEQEKSSHSLAQIYEQEYLKASEEKEEKKPKEHEEIQKMMNSLFMKLDALSNFHYTPKLAVPEVKIISNMPSIAMEEVQPVSMSDVAMLAPEEIKEKKQDELKGVSEKTGADKVRLRKRKKALKRLKQKERDKKQKALASKGTNTVKEKKAAMERAAKDVLRDNAMGRLTVTQPTATAKATKSSTAFFNSLQDQVKASIANKRTVKKQKNTSNVSAAKLRL